MCIYDFKECKTVKEGKTYWSHQWAVNTEMSHKMEENNTRMVNPAKIGLVYVRVNRHSRYTFNCACSRMRIRSR